LGWTSPKNKIKIKIKKMNSAWALSPAGPTYVAKGVFGKNIPLCLGHNFMAILVNIWPNKPLFYIKKF
jgi:hypothetical protein